MIVPNTPGIGKFSTGRHACRQIPVDQHHATRPPGSLSGALGGNIRPAHRTPPIAGASTSVRLPENIAFGSPPLKIPKDLQSP